MFRLSILKLKRRLSEIDFIEQLSVNCRESMMLKLPTVRKWAKEGCKTNFAMQIKINIKRAREITRKRERGEERKREKEGGQKIAILVLQVVTQNSFEIISCLTHYSPLHFNAPLFSTLFSFFDPLLIPSDLS